MFNYRKLTDTVQVDFPDPKYAYSKTIQVIGSINLNLPIDSVVLSIENHGENIILKLNGQSFFIVSKQVRFINKTITRDTLFEHKNAYITVNYITPPQVA